MLKSNSIQNMVSTSSIPKAQVVKSPTRCRTALDAADMQRIAIGGHRGVCTRLGVLV